MDGGAEGVAVARPREGELALARASHARTAMSRHRAGAMDSQDYEEDGE